MAFTQGQEVTQIVPAPIQGTIAGFGFDPNTGNVTILVSYTDADGNEQQSYFQQSQFEATPVAE